MIPNAQGPKANGEDVSWEDLHTKWALLAALAATGKEVVLLTQTFVSNYCKNYR